MAQKPEMAITSIKMKFYPNFYPQMAEIGGNSGMADPAQNTAL